MKRLMASFLLMGSSALHANVGSDLDAFLMGWGMPPT